MDSKKIIIEHIKKMQSCKVVDGYSNSREHMIKFESKYHLSSKSFYHNYIKNILNTITVEDADDWSFYCETYERCGGVI